MSEAIKQVHKTNIKSPLVRTLSHQLKKTKQQSNNQMIITSSNSNSKSIIKDDKNTSSHKDIVNQQQHQNKYKAQNVVKQTQKTKNIIKVQRSKNLQKQPTTKTQSIKNDQQAKQNKIQLPPIVQKYVITKSSSNKYSVNKVINQAQTKDEVSTLKQTTSQTVKSLSCDQQNKLIQQQETTETETEEKMSQKTNQQQRSKYQQLPDPTTHIYNIPKFEQMMDDIMHQPELKVNTKRMIQKQFQIFWNYEQATGLESESVLKQEEGDKKEVKQKYIPKLQDFVKGKKLGKGMFGEVFFAIHKQTGFACALKVLSKQVLRIQKVEDQFVEELKLHSFLTHPNIVQVYGYFDDEQNIYVMQQLCTGGQLFDLLIKRRRISQKRAAYYMKQLVQGLRFIHTMDVTHRDIKPQNILLESGVVKICDFGWAIYSIDNQHKGKCGTPLYLSPQVVQDHSYSELVDVWGVGLITYELLVGNIPWNIWTEQDIQKIVDEDLTFPQYIPVSQTAKNFITRALTKNPQQRITLLQTFTDPFLISINPMQYQDQSFTGYGQATP